MLRYQYSDGGRESAGFKGRAGDCVTRAMAIATGKPYRECYRALAKANKVYTGVRSARNGVRKEAYVKVFSDAGMVQIPINWPVGRGPKPTLTQAAKKFPTCIVTTAKHMIAIKDGVLRDTWDTRTHWFGGVETERKAMSIWIDPSR